MNVKLLLTLGLVVGSAWTMRDTISTGSSLILGRAEAIDAVVSGPRQEAEVNIEREKEIDRYQAESDARIRHWRDCTRVDYKAEHREACRLLEGGP